MSIHNIRGRTPGSPQIFSVRQRDRMKKQRFERESPEKCREVNNIKKSKKKSIERLKAEENLR